MVERKKSPEQMWLDELRYWPYTIHQIDDTLDSELIEGRAKQLLFQALNSASATAFIGSGVSSSYGRMGWDDWKDEQLRQVEEMALAFIYAAEETVKYLEAIVAVFKKEQNNRKQAFQSGQLIPPDRLPEEDPETYDVRLGQRWLGHRLQGLKRALWDVRNLHKTFVAAKSNSGSFLGGEDLPVLFEIAKQLHDLLMLHRAIFSGPDDHPPQVNKESANPSSSKLLSNPNSTRRDWHNYHCTKLLNCWIKKFSRWLPGDASSEQKLNWANQEYPKYLFGVAVRKSDGAPVEKLLGLARWALRARHSESPHTMKYQHKKTFYAVLAFNERLKDPAMTLDFETLAKSLLIDECPHAVHLLRQGLSYGENSGRSNNSAAKVKSFLEQHEDSPIRNLKRDIDGIRQSPDHYKILHHFNINLLRDLLKNHTDEVPEVWRPMLRHLINDLDAYIDPDKQAALSVPRTYLTPTSRFLLPMFLALLKDPAKTFITDTSGPTSADPESFMSRRSIIAHRFDPLERISEGLKINRFLTTNYDFEIERLFQDKGYNRFDPHKALPSDVQAASDALQFRTNGLGGQLRDMTFQSETATDLLGFAASRGEADASVFHLHGRATMRDRIVATERDYMDLYMRHVPNRDVVDESILMAFAASPILFLGLGMTEADVLRPLRQFMSDQDRSIGYRAIVLLPADQDFDSRAKLSAGLYLRYGAHTIFYGSGEVENDEDGKNRLQLDWLHRVMVLIKALKKAAQTRLKDIPPAKELLDENDPRYNDASSFSDLHKDTQSGPNAPLLSPEALAEAVGTLGINLLRDDEDPTLAESPGLVRLLALPNADPISRAQSVSEELEKAISELAKLNSGTPAWIDCNAEISRKKQELASSLEDWRIVTCTHTTQRYQNNENPESKRGVTVDGATYSEFYVSRLNELLQIALNASQYTCLADEQRSLNAMILALDGIKAALHTASFCASLESLHKEWRAWWQDWQSSPPTREARFQRLAPPESSDRLVFPRREVRHKVEGVITDLEHIANKIAPPIETLNHKDQTVYPGPNDVPADDPCYQTGVRIFDRFIYDLYRMSQTRPPNTGRLLTTVAAERGFGKGVFFSTLCTRLGLSCYIRAAHPESGEPEGPTFFSSIFVNFSFACEIASTLDMMVDSLTRSVAQLRVLKSLNVGFVRATGLSLSSFLTQFVDLDGEPYRELGDLYDVLNSDVGKEVQRLQIGDKRTAAELHGLSRFEKFTFLLRAFKAEALEVTGTFPSIRPRILFCLNSVDLLFDSRKRPKNREIADYLNFLSHTENKDLPFDLLSVGALEGMGHFFGNNTRLNRVTFVWEELSNELKANLHYRAEKCDLIPCEDGSAMSFLPHPVHYVHLARRTDPRRFLVDNFPVLAMGLLEAREARKEKRTQTQDPDDGLLSRAVKSAHSYMWQTREQAWFASEPPDCNEQYLTSRHEFNKAVARAYVKGRAKTDPLSIAADTSDLPRFADGLYDEFTPDLGSQDFADWQDLMRVLEGNRFCLTILLAAAEQIMLTEPDFIKGGEAANDLLESVVAGLRNSSAGQREEYVLSTVMSVNRHISRIGNPDYDHHLHMLLLRNIAALGCPVSPSILVRLPDVREYFNKTVFDRPLSRRRLVARALSALSERGLLFRISPHAKLLRLNDRCDYFADRDDKQMARDALEKVKSSFEEWPARKEYRYALHRQIQSFCFQRLGHLTAPPVDANNFSPTLYTAMPSRVVRLSTEGYLFLRRLLLGLSQYPDIRHEDAARAMPIFNDDDIVLRVQALRAALSLARTCFSIAAVSRFDQGTTGLDFIRKRGHFETYRVRLRWILRKAWEVHEPRGKEGRETADQFRVNSLYADEVVWLYNEVAVTCLVQGNLIEAVAHARQAVFLNRSSEGPNDGGRMHNILSLNLAIIQFERGRLRSAEVRLKAIVASEGKGPLLLCILAEGYLGLIKQLKGQRHEAEKSLGEIVEKLESLNEDRALAIMTHHLARLIASHDVTKANDYMRRARDYAEKGGHEDVRYRIMVSEVWISQTFTADPQDRMEADRVKLREAERYATTMGVHSLLVECLHAQGLMLLKAGDFSRSGRLMTKAMAIARRNDMTLRLNSAMTNYAKVLLARRRVASAKRLLLSALAVAKRSGYSLEVVRIHKVLDEAERSTTASDAPARWPSQGQ